MPGFNVGRTFGNCDAPDIPGGALSLLSHTVETTRRNRYILEFNPNGLLYQVSQTGFGDVVRIPCLYADRPSPRITRERIWNGADYINVPLRGEYDNINVSIYETIKVDDSGQPVVNDIAESILAWWTKSAFSFEDSRNTYPDSRRIDVRLSMLDGAGRRVWDYKLIRCWPEVIIPDQMNYKDSDISTTQLSLSFDKVKYSRNFDDEFEV